MEIAALFIAFGSFAAAAVAAVIAVFQHAASAKAAERAEIAEQAARTAAEDALSAWRLSSEALVSLAAYSRERDETRRALEDRARRLSIGAAMKRWAEESIVEAISRRGAAPLEPFKIPPDLTLMIRELGDPSAEQLRQLLTDAIIGARIEIDRFWKTGPGPSGGMHGLQTRLYDPVTTWVEDPAAFAPLFEEFERRQADDGSRAGDEFLRDERA